jgi:Zn-dependent M28 family amino/carboxypeptidase
MCEPMTAWNVIGELPGSQEPEQVVMIGSHYDGHDISQGAEDPACGAASVLEAARALAKYASLDRTVRFALWAVEEINLIGSKAYVREHDGELSNLRFYLNMDSAGAAWSSRDVILSEWPDLEPLFTQWRDEMVVDFAVGQSATAHSDHYPFLLQGVPTGGLGNVVKTTSGRGYGHTMYDTVDKLELKGMREAACRAARLAIRIANEKKWPVARRSKEDVQALYDTPEYREEQEFFDRYRAFLKQERN